MAESICHKLNIPAGSLAIDIGSNVGVLLEGFKKMKMDVVGVDPAPKMAAIANKRGIATINAFFQDSVVEQVLNIKGKATIITGTNVFAHIDNLDGLMDGVKKLLTQDGFFVFELPHLIPMIENLEYDTIYHQHLSYVSIKPLIPFFNKFNMEIFDLDSEKIHGGSMRFFVAEKGRMHVQPIVEDTLSNENEKGMYSLDRLKKFAEEVNLHRMNLLTMLVELRKQGKRIVGIGAAAKGNTLLNYCGIHSGLLDYITEKSTLKVGRFSPGLHIPVVPDEMLLEDKPDYGLILPWNLADEIMKNLSEFKANGGKFIVPIPYPIII
jgi:SAM-dependent methyltransferase